MKNKAFIHSFILSFLTYLSWVSTLKTHLVPHVRLEVELGRRAKSCGEHLHEPLPVAPRVQTVHGVLDDVQTLVARRLQVVLGRQVGPEGPVQTGVVSQIAALAGRGRGGRFLKIAEIETHHFNHNTPIQGRRVRSPPPAPGGVRPHKQAGWR